MKIEYIEGIELLDSRGNPTIGVKIADNKGNIGFAIAPSGASTGKYEAFELRDGDKKVYNGKGTKKAVENVNKTIFDNVLNKCFCDQRSFDEMLLELDGTENKSKLGANALVATSLAFAKANAMYTGIPLYKYIGGENATTLPIPMMNILNGGAHSSNNIDIQEFMIVPVFKATFSERIRACVEVYHKLGEILKEKNLSCGVGDEGGFAPQLPNEEAAIELIIEAVDKSGYNTDDIKISLDIASSEWYSEKIYKKPKTGEIYDFSSLLQYYENLLTKYPIISMEDPFSDDDWESWKTFTNLHGKNLQIVGDDLFVTNYERLKKGINENVGNAILIKPNQIGTLTETLDVIKLAKMKGYKTIISHRSGETEDTSIADICVGTNAGQIKTGAPCRTDRVSKYNRLLLIEKEILTNSKKVIK